jgi:hypothetical protein
VSFSYFLWLGIHPQIVPSLQSAQRKTFPWFVCTSIWIALRIFLSPFFVPHWFVGHISSCDSYLFPRYLGDPCIISFFLGQFNQQLYRFLVAEFVRANEQSSKVGMTALAFLFVLKEDDILEVWLFNFDRNRPARNPPFSIFPLAFCRDRVTSSPARIKDDMASATNANSSNRDFFGIRICRFPGDRNWLAPADRLFAG